jgi:hypothetical protein
MPRTMIIETGFVGPQNRWIAPGSAIARFLATGSP